MVGVTADGRYYIYEAGGADISWKKIRQLEKTMEMLGKEKVLSLTFVMKEKITSKGYSVENNELLLNGQRELIHGKPIRVLFTTQGK